MEVIRSSVLCRTLAPFWLWLCRCYDGSVLAKVIRGIGSGWDAACRGSVLIGFLTRDGFLSAAWRDSLVCRILMAVINLPVKLFQWLYRHIGAALEDSWAARLAFNLVEETPILAGWFMLAFLVIPYENWNNAYSLGGFAFCLVLTMAAGIRKKDYRLDIAAVGPWLLLFAGAVVVSCLLSSSEDSPRFLLYHAACMLCVLVIVSTVERLDQLQRLMGCASFAVLVMSCCAFFQRASGIEVNPSYVDMTSELNKGMPGRVFAFYENPNAFGEVLSLLIPVVIVYMLTSRRWSGRALGLVSALAGCAALIMTYSRASWLGFAFAIFLLVAMWKRNLLPVFVAAAFVGLALLPDTVFNRILSIFDTSDTSTSSRFPYYQAALTFLKQHPLTGAGLGSDAVRDAVRGMHLYHGHDYFVHCHNTYLQLWCETGLVGLITFVGGIFWTFKRGAKAAAKAACSPALRLAVLGGASALMGSMLCGMADYTWNYPRVMLIFWFVCALTLAGIRLAGREAEQEPCAEQA